MTPKQSTIYLCAPVNALVEGIYEEKIPFATVRQHGDFGLGTFDHLDGEMIMLDGRIYHIAGNGRIDEVVEPATTPFACVSFYSPDSHHDLVEELTYTAFEDWILGLLPSPNIIYALRIEGCFAGVRVRSVSRQEHYRPLVEVANEEQVFTYAEAQGTLAGFYTPAFLGSLSVPGLHLHFLSDDRTEGGHLLECRPRGVHAGVQLISSLELALPMSRDYLTWDFHRDAGADLGKAER